MSSRDGMSRSLAAFLLLLGFAAARPAFGQEAQTIADGHAIALKVCAACHVAAPDQTVPPTMKPPAPPFAEIAGRPNVTEAFLRDFLIHPHGEARATSAMPGFLVPGRAADAVIAYLLSLKAGRRRETPSESHFPVSSITDSARFLAVPRFANRPLECLK